MYSYAHALTHARTHTLTHSRSNTLTYTQIHTYTLTHSHTRSHTHAHTLTLIHTLTQTHSHTLTPTHTHTYTHTHTQIHKRRFSFASVNNIAHYTTFTHDCIIILRRCLKVFFTENCILNIFSAVNCSFYQRIIHSYPRSIRENVLY